MQIRATRKDVLWNYLGTFLNLGINFVMLPIFMFFLTSDYLALWYVFASLGSIVNMFDFGFTPVLSRNVAYCWSGAKELSKVGVSKVSSGYTAEPNFELLAKVMRTCRLLYFAIALTAAIVLGTCGTLYISSLIEGLSRSECLSAWLIYVLSIFMNLYFGYYVVLLRGVGKIDAYNQSVCTGKVLQIAVSATLLLMGFGLVAVAVAFCLYGLLSRALFRRAFFSFEEIRSHSAELKGRSTIAETIGMFSIVWHNAWREGIVSLAKYLTSQAGTILCSLFFTLSQTGLYSISLQITTAIASVSSVVFNAYNPSMQNAYALRDTERATQLLSKSMICYDSLFIGLYCVFLIVGIPVLEAIGTSYSFDVIATTCIAAFSFIYQRHSNYASFIANTNQIPYMGAYLMSGIIGIVLACLVLTLSPQLGIVGLVLPQLAVQLSYNSWKWPSTAFKILSVTFKDFVSCGLRFSVPRLIGRFH